MMKELDVVFDGVFLFVRAGISGVDLARRFLGLAAVRLSLRVLAVGSLHAALFLGVAWGFLHRVGVGEIGVRERLFASGGVEAVDHAPGLRASPRWLEAWHHLDARTHVIAFGIDAESGGEPALELRTRDGNLARVSASVLYRIREGQAWRMVAAGLKESYAGLARRAAADVLSTELAGLESSDFWDSDLRQARVAQARVALNERLAALFLEAETIQIGDVSFWSEYEQALARERSEREGVRVAEALWRLEQELRGDPGLDVIDTEEELEAEEERRGAEHDRDLELVRSEALIEIARIERDAKSYAALRESEADAIYERELSLGQLALERAETGRERSIAAALEGPAGRLWLAREAAGSAKLQRALVESYDPRMPSPFDVDRVVELLLGIGLETGATGSKGP